MTFWKLKLKIRLDFGGTRTVNRLRVWSLQK